MAIYSKIEDVANEVGLSVSTIKKYCLLIEERAQIQKAQSRLSYVFQRRY